MGRIFKAKIEGDWNDPDGIRVTSFANRLIPLGLFKALNDAVHEVIDTYNGKFYWRKLYIKFDDKDGTRYEQYDGPDENSPCTGCVFLRDKICQHPHKWDGSKGFCNNPYRIAKED